MRSLLIALVIVVVVVACDAIIIRNKAQMGVRLNADMGVNSQMRAMLGQHADTYGAVRPASPFWSPWLAGQHTQGSDAEAGAGLDAMMRRTYNGLSVVDTDMEAVDDGVATINSRHSGARRNRLSEQNDIHRFNKFLGRTGGSHAFKSIS